MRKILLSFKPFWFEKIKTGEKIFEYRKRFCDESVIAYAYVSKPVMAVTGIVILGQRVSLDEWKKEYKDDENVLNRINNFSKTNNYAMPILEFIPTTSIKLKDIQKAFPKFLAPQMYYNLPEGSELLSFLEKNIRMIDGGFENSFEGKLNNKICEELT